MDDRAGLGTGQLFLTDSRLALAVLNHLRYQALNRAFGVSRDQASVLSVVLLLGAADTAYEATRRIRGMRVRLSGGDAAVWASRRPTAAIALRDAALGVAGPSSREIPGFGTLVALAILGGVAAPGLRQAAHRMRAAEQRLRAAEQRVRRERIRRYMAARDRMRVGAA